MIELILYFLAGLATDLVVTVWYIAIYEKKPMLAAVFSFILTMLTYGVFYTMIVGPDFLLNLIFYGLGGSVGTAVTILYKKRGKPFKIFWFGRQKSETDKRAETDL